MYNLISNAISDDCPQEDETYTGQFFCIRDYVSTLTIANKRNHVKRINIQLILNLVTTVVLIIGFLKIRHIFRVIFQRYDSKNITPSDFTLRLNRVPSHVTNEQIIEWINSLGDAFIKPKVEKICRTYRISEFVRLYKREENLQVLLKTPKYLNNSVKIQAELEEVRSKLAEIRKQKLEYGPVVFITFQTSRRIKLNGVS